MTTAVTAATQRRARTHPLVLMLRWLVVLTLIVGVLGATAVAFAPAPRVAATPVELPMPAAQPVTATWPTEVAQQAGFAVAGLDGTAEAWGSTTPLPMASLTKLITALTVLEQHPLTGDERGATVTLDRADLGALGAAIAENAPTVQVHAGMQVSQRDLLEWSLVDSAANATWSMARWAFGSEEAFVEAANDWAARHGLTDTVVADPSGLLLASRSTAADMTELALLAVANPVVLHTIGLERVPVPGGFVTNTNPLLGTSFVDGGKTGSLRVSGRNLFVTAERELEGASRRVVVVVLGVAAEDDIAAATETLVTSLWDDFGTAPIVPADTLVAEYRAPWGASVRATTESTLEADAFGAAVPTPTVSLSPDGVGVDLPRGDVGTVQVIDTRDSAVEVAVRTDGLLPGPDIGWRMTHPLDVLRWYVD